MDQLLHHFHLFLVYLEVLEFLLHHQFHLLLLVLEFPEYLVVPVGLLHHAAAVLEIKEP